MRTNGVRYLIITKLPYLEILSKNEPPGDPRIKVKECGTRARVKKRFAGREYGVPRYPGLPDTNCVQRLHVDPQTSRYAIMH